VLSNNIVKDHIIELVKANTLICSRVFGGRAVDRRGSSAAQQFRGLGTGRREGCRSAEASGGNG
jgi:hypothetical protein